MQINFKILIIQNRWAFNLSNVFIGLEIICIGKSKYVAFWKWGPDHGDWHWLLWGAALVEAPLLLLRTCAPQPWDTIHRDMAVQVSFCGYLSPGAAKFVPCRLLRAFWQRVQSPPEPPTATILGHNFHEPYKIILLHYPVGMKACRFKYTHNTHAYTYTRTRCHGI